ncbi:MAG: zinc ribbon domain-containing protein [Anaerolineae bacterium]|nr:zinc ribbon domain-containing protein [Anaerolineae bacterium]
MNCPTCGAKNEADARFCAECGTPLEGEVDQPPEEEDSDRTILSTVSEISEEAKTVAVSQDDVANLAAEMEQAEDAEFETGAPSSPPIPPAGGDGNGKSDTQRYIIIAVVALLVLCCCCFLLAGIISVFSNEDIMKEFSSIGIRDVSPHLLAFI